MYKQGQIWKCENNWEYKILSVTDDVIKLFSKMSNVEIKISASDTYKYLVKKIKG